VGRGGQEGPPYGKKRRPNDAPSTNYVMPARGPHRDRRGGYRHRGYTAKKPRPRRRSARDGPSRHQTHKAIKARQLDEHFGSKAGGASRAPDRGAAQQVQGGREVELPNPSWAGNGTWRRWDECMRLADEFGVGVVHRRQRVPLPLGCGRHRTAAARDKSPTRLHGQNIAEVVPFGGKSPRSAPTPPWAFHTRTPTVSPYAIEWGNQRRRHGPVQRFARERKDSARLGRRHGRPQPPTPNKVTAIFTVGDHTAKACR